MRPVFSRHGRQRFGKSIERCTVIILRQCTTAVVKIDDAMGDEVVLIVKVDFLRGDS